MKPAPGSPCTGWPRQYQKMPGALSAIANMPAFDLARIAKLGRVAVARRWRSHVYSRWTCNGRLFKALGQAVQFLGNKTIGASGGPAAAIFTFAQEIFFRGHRNFLLDCG